MGDSEDEYDRKRRDKFRGERAEASYRGTERAVRSREDWPERESWSRPRAREYRGSIRDRGYSPGMEPTPKRMRHDPYYPPDNYYNQYQPYHPPSHRDPPAAQEGQQPPMMTFKAFLATQDDNISDSEAIEKYNDYKLEFQRQQLNEFFVAHKDDEWFRLKYHPEDSVKRKEEQMKALKKRVEVFIDLLNSGKLDNVGVDVPNTTDLVKLLDTVVIKLEGGTDADLAVLEQEEITETTDELKAKTLEKDVKASAKTTDSDGKSKTDDSKNEENGDTKKQNGEKDDDSSVEEIKDENDDNEKDKKENDDKEKTEEKDDVKEDGNNEEEERIENAGKQEEKLKKEEEEEEENKNDVKEDNVKEEEDEELKEEEEKMEVDNKDEEAEKLEEKIDEPEEKKKDDYDDEDKKSEKSDKNNDDKDENTSKPTKKRKRSFYGSDNSSSSDSDSDHDEKNDKEKVDKEKDEDEKEEEDEEEGGKKDKEKNDDKEKSEEIKDDKEQEEEEVKKDDSPRALHKTTSIFLRNLAPTITKQEVEAMCSRYNGFLRVALADPQPERRWLRRGWVTFTRNANIKEICWNLNNIRLRDCELGAIVNRDLSRRIRPVNGITAHKTVVRSDIRISAKVALHLDTKAGLWSNEEDQIQPQQTFGLVSNNPVLKNITDYLIEEASAEEEELLGLQSSADAQDATSVIVERDDCLITVLDRIILYLRIVHSVDYYNHCEYPNEDEMPNRCGILHARGPPPTTQTDITAFVGNVIEQKMSHFLPEKPVTVDQNKNDSKLISLAMKDVDTEIDKFVQANTRELAKDKWLCPLSGKKFKGPDFVRKHIFNKHSEKIEEVKKEVEFFNNYLKDPKRPMLEAAPAKREDTQPTYQHTSYGGGGYGGYNGPPRYQNQGYNQRYRNFSRPRGGGADYRPVIHYRDLDAPREPEEFI